METLDLQTVIDNLPPCDDEALHKASCDALKRILVKERTLNPSCEMAAHIYKVKSKDIEAEIRQALPKNYFKDRALATSIKMYNRISMMSNARR